MKQLHVILRVFTLIAFVAATLPLQMFEDAHFDGNIDLRDVISAVRQFEGSAIDTETFAQTVRMAVSTLEVAADLKTVIKADQSSSLQRAPFTQTPVLTASAVGASETLVTFIDWRDISTTFNSADLFPPTPPPKLV